MSTDQSEAIRNTLREAAAVLRDAEIPFALAGGLAAWARGGPEVDHDADFVILPSDAERALAAFEAKGFRSEKPIENWLYKVYDGDVMIDLIFETAGLTTAPFIERAEDIEVLAIHMPVMRPDDVMITKLNALSEHDIALESPLKIARAIRERIDWENVRSAVKDSPFAMAFLTLVEELGIASSGHGSVADI